MYEMIIINLITRRSWREVYNNRKEARARYFKLEHSKILKVAACDLSIID